VKTEVFSLFSAIFFEKSLKISLIDQKKMTTKENLSRLSSVAAMRRPLI